MATFPGLPLADRAPGHGPLRVCLVCMQFAGVTRCGGVGTAFFSLAETLAGHGHAVTVLLACDDVDRASLAERARRLAGAGITLVHLPRLLHRGSRFEGRAEASFNCHQWLKRRHFDVIHFHEWLGLAYYPLLAKRQGLAYRSTVLCVGTHGPEQWALQGNGVLPSEIGQLETHAMERESVRLADVVVSPSQYLLRWLKKEGWSLPERTYVHPNPLWSKATSTPRRVDGQVPVAEFVFFGRLEPRKGLYLFCDAIERLARPGRSRLRVTFLGRKQWLGDREEWSDVLLQERTRDWPYEVSILTDRSHEEALDYLRIPGRLAVIPSRLENSPYTVLECLGAGICLISADVGGIRELIHGDDRPRVLFKGEELAAKLREALDEGASPARPAVDLNSVRERWVRWHETELAALEEPGPPPRRPLAPARPRSLGVCVLADAPPLWDRWAQECATIAGRADGLFGAPAEALQASESEFLLIATATTHVDPRFVARGMRVLDTTGASMVTSVAYHRWPFRRRYRPGRPLFFPIPAAACAAAFRPVLGDHALLVRRRDCAKAIGGLDDRPEMSIWDLALEWTLAGLRLEVMPEPWLGTPLMPSLDPPRGQTAHRQRVDALSRRMPVALDGLLSFVHRLHKHRARSSPAAWPARVATARAPVRTPPSP